MAYLGTAIVLLAFGGRGWCTAGELRNSRWSLAPVRDVGSHRAASSSMNTAGWLF